MNEPTGVRAAEAGRHGQMIQHLLPRQRLARQQPRQRRRLGAQGIRLALGGGSRGARARLALLCHGAGVLGLGQRVFGGLGQGGGLGGHILGGCEGVHRQINRRSA